ncbi:MAG: VWA domain-containing protein [Acidobacteriota bacterium]|nr:VWA domain-containing protein [Acidobacteriota bacterium]
MDRQNRSLSFQSCVATVVAAAALAAIPLAMPMRGQSGSPAPSSTIQASPSGAPVGQQDTTQVTTIRTFSNLVVIDVVVTDSQGNPVRGLKQSDFTLSENNNLQTVRHFEEHTALPISNIKIATPPPLPKGLFTNKSAAPVNGPVNVLLLDYLNTPVTAQPYARKQLMEFLNKAPAGTRIGIFALTNHLVMLQGFTSDIAVLKDALTQKKGAPQTSDILSDTGSVGNTVLSDAMANDTPAVDGMVTQQMVDDVNRFQTLDASFQQDMIARITLDAFDTLARYLVGIPGRKNVIWFSGGFPLNVEPDVNEADPNDSVVRNDDAIRKTDNLLTRAQVAVYPVDARGVFSSDSTLDVSNNMAAITDASGAAVSQQLTANLNATAQQHETMEAMAEDTGGHAFYNTNDLTTAVTKAVENGSNYYTLTYSPTNTQWDARFRSVKVKIDQPNVKLAYRNGYYAIDPNDRSKQVAGGAATALVQPTTMATAMLHGGPDPAEILFKVRIRPANMPPQDTPLASNRTNPDPKVKVSGPYKAYGVDLVPDAKAMSCHIEPSGNRHCAIEVWTFVYNSQGERLISASNRLYKYMTAADYAKLLSGGMAFHQEISVPLKGNYFVRTAVHDMISDRVGAVEVPIAVVAHLDPLQAEVAPAPAAPTDGSAVPAATIPAATQPATPAPPQ